MVLSTFKFSRIKIIIKMKVIVATVRAVRAVAITAKEIEQKSTLRISQ